MRFNLVVEGTVHVDADRVRVQVRMMDPDFDRKFALHEFDGTAQGLEDLQRRIAMAIVQQRQRRLPVQDRRPKSPRSK